MDTKKIKLVPVDEFAALGDQGFKAEDTGGMTYNAETIKATGDEFWSVMIAAKRRGISFHDYIWSCAVQQARTEV